MKISSVVAVAAALMLIAACETSPDGAGAGSGAAGGGAGGGTVSGTGSPSGGLGGRSGMVGDVSVSELARELEQVGDTVYFAFDDFTLSPEARVAVERQATLLASSPSVDVRINGHTDERGTREYNLALADRRANAVKDYLVALGIPPSRVQTVAYGEERPAVLGSTEAAWARNRRAVTEVVGGRVGS